MKEILQEIGLGLLGIFGFAIGCMVLTFILAPILWAIGKPWEKFMNWLGGPEPLKMEKVVWAEHEDRAYIRDRRRQIRPAFILGVILVVVCAATVFVADGRVELNVWLGFFVGVTGFMGLGLVISPGLELLSLRRDEKDLKRRQVMLHPATHSEVQRESVAATSLAR